MSLVVKRSPNPEVTSGLMPSELILPGMVHAMITRYLTQDHLEVVYESVARELQQPEESEDEFA